MNFSRILCGLTLGAAACWAQVTVVSPPTADPVTRLAASELVSYLSRIYPDEKISLAERAPAGGAVVEFTRRAGTPESYSIRATGKRAVIAAADARGSLYAVYALLEKLGCGFYLSHDGMPAPRQGALTFAGWSLEDAPVYSDRFIFQWHNFLSSASTWEYEDWERYINATARMRFNGLMVHAYGNNPMFQFRFRGLNKPVGYLATTRAGRDWGTEHVNDVRRLVGGELFPGPVFGSSIAQVAEAERAPAAIRTMQRVFQHAASRGLGITFALDVDTESANPQAIIATLPASARVTSGKFQLANPDTPEGYEFYKAQVEQLLKLYPQITRLAVWHRNDTTPWMAVKVADFPAGWKEQFRGDPSEAGLFAVGRIIAAFGRALKETGHGNVELATGTWRLHLIESSDRLFPKEATMMPLDWATVFDTPTAQRQLRSIRSGRKLVPIVWAHHDDRTYVGRPYPPYVNFSTLLGSSGGKGFGIIHWTTRPLDLYFKSTVDQVWKASENQPLEIACERMAERLFGPAAREAGRDYLFSWLTEAPMFGRETTDRFMDIPLVDPVAHVRRFPQRMRLLEQVRSEAEMVTYFRKSEEFMQAFFSAHLEYEKAEAALKAGDYAAVRAAMERARPEEAIRRYAEAIRVGGASRGELALVVSLNLRWLPYFVSMRQVAGLEPIRYRIGKVETEPLAQSPGRLTFHADEQGRLWRVIDREAAAAGPLKLGGIMGHQLPAGQYAVAGGGAPLTPVDGFLTVNVAAGAGEELVIERR